MDTLQCERLMVTLGEHGTWLHAPEEQLNHVHLPALKRDIVDVSGAGDTVISVAAMLLACGIDSLKIASIANLAGGWRVSESAWFQLKEKRSNWNWPTFNFLNLNHCELAVIPRAHERLALQSKSQVLQVFQWLNLIVNLVALAVLAIYYGYDHNAPTSDALFRVVKVSFGFYLLHYFIRALYHFHPKEFFRQTWAEGIVMGVLLVEGVGDLLLGSPPLGEALATLVPSIGDFSTIVVQGYLFVAILVEWLRPGSGLPRIRLHPAIIFILSFLLLIIVGTWLLTMPEMTTMEGSMPAVDAFFTATSATCVTGLMSVDTMTYFTAKGHWVLLFLIQLGGLNFIAFGSFLALASKFGVAVKQHDVIEDFVNSDNLLGSTGTLRKVIIWCLSLEALVHWRWWHFGHPTCHFRVWESAFSRRFSIAFRRSTMLVFPCSQTDLHTPGLNTIISCTGS